MDLRTDSHVFLDVVIPVLWGTRAIIEDKKGRLSIIDLGGPEAALEILGDKPAPGVKFRPLSGGVIEVLEDGGPLYAFDAAQKAIRGVNLRLPECRIDDHSIRIGTSTIRNVATKGFEIGILVTANSIAIGAPMPPGLAKLRI